MRRFLFSRAVLCLALFVTTGLALRLSAARPGTEMAGAASRLLATFSPEQRSRAAFLFASDERTRWHFLPSEMFPHHGVALKELNADQRPAAHALLQAGLSQRGYLAATAIMELERVLRSLEQDGRIARDPEAYYISIFGMPDAEGTRRGGSRDITCLCTSRSSRVPSR